MKIYTTKNALTIGIICFDTEKGDIIAQSGSNCSNCIVNNDEIFTKSQFYTSSLAAIEYAEAMRAKKIAALQKQIDDLKKLCFEE